MNALLLIVESSGLDRYLNSGANLLKLTEVVWLYLVLFCPMLTITAFIVSKRTNIGFLVQIRNQHLKIDPCDKFQPDWTKCKGTRISTWISTGIVYGGISTIFQIDGKNTSTKSRAQKYESNFRNTKFGVLYSGNFLETICWEISWKLYAGKFGWMLAAF